MRFTLPSANYLPLNLLKHMGLGVTFAQGTSVNIIRSIGLAFFFLHRGLSKCWPHSGSFLPPLPPAFSPCFSSRVEGVVCPVFYPFSPCFEAWTPHRCRTPPPPPPGAVESPGFLSGQVLCRLWAIPPPAPLACPLLQSELVLATKAMSHES